MKTTQIKVKPNARTSALEQMDGGSWKTSIESTPVDGKANQELIKLIVKQFGCPESAVTIKSGAGSRQKLVQISDD